MRQPPSVSSKARNSMKHLIILIFISLCQQLTSDAQCSIAGHLYDKEKKTNVNFVEVRLLGFPLKYKTFTYSDSIGNYYLDSIPEGRHDFLFYTSEYNDTIVYDIQFVKDSTTYVNIFYPTFCEYSKSKSKCPKCSKKDKVVPIVYGYPSEKMLVKMKKGKIHLGGCMVSGCDPKWFCKRDETEF